MNPKFPVKLPHFTAEWSLLRAGTYYSQEAANQRTRPSVRLAENCSGGGGTCMCNGKCIHTSTFCRCKEEERTIN